MWVSELRDDHVRLFGFEIPAISRHRACAIAARIPGVELIRRQKRFAWFSEEEFCEFQLNGETFVIWEPFGDNSRYWVGRRGGGPSAHLPLVKEAFAAARGWWRF